MTFKEFIDKKLSGEDISKIKSLDVSVKLNSYTQKIEDLYGIEDFLNLETLSARDQELSELPELPKKLKRLDVSRNKIFKFSFEEFPKRLKFLDLSENSTLFRIPILHKKLIDLRLSGTAITCIDKIPEALEILLIDATKSLNEIKEFSLSTPIKGFLMNGSKLAQIIGSDSLNDLLLHVNLRAGHDCRGEASIMDTGLFDFKTN